MISKISQITNNINLSFFKTQEFKEAFKEYVRLILSICASYVLGKILAQLFIIILSENHISQIRNVDDFKEACNLIITLSCFLGLQRYGNFIHIFLIQSVALFISFSHPKQILAVTAFTILLIGLTSIFKNMAGFAKLKKNSSFKEDIVYLLFITLIIFAGYVIVRLVINNFEIY